jgi:hypothetical protein
MNIVTGFFFEDETFFIILGVIEAFFGQVELFLQNHRMVLYEWFFLAISGK